MLRQRRVLAVAGALLAQACLYDVPPTLGGSGPEAAAGAGGGAGDPGGAGQGGTDLGGGGGAAGEAGNQARAGAAGVAGGAAGAQGGAAGAQGGAAGAQGGAAGAQGGSAGAESGGAGTGAGGAAGAASGNAGASGAGAGGSAGGSLGCGGGAVACGGSCVPCTFPNGTGACDEKKAICTLASCAPGMVRASLNDADGCSPLPASMPATPSLWLDTGFGIKGTGGSAQRVWWWQPRLPAATRAVPASDDFEGVSPAIEQTANGPRVLFPGCDDGTTPSDYAVRALELTPLVVDLAQGFTIGVSFLPKLPLQRCEGVDEKYPTLFDFAGEGPSHNVYAGFKHLHVAGQTAGPITAVFFGAQLDPATSFGLDAPLPQPVAYDTPMWMVVSKAPGGPATLSVNGTALASGPGADFAAYAVTKAFLGRNQAVAKPSAQRFKGYLRELVMFERALSASDAAALDAHLGSGKLASEPARVRLSPAGAGAGNNAAPGPRPPPPA